ncbi:MAG: signal peptidase I [Spirochaetia bacterium]|jgi:signal peptidase I
MIGSVERYSPATAKRRAGLFGGRVLRILLIALVLYLVVSRFFVSTYRIESVSMEPALRPAERVIVSSIAYGPRVPFTASRLPGMGMPERGDLVVVQPPFVVEPSLIARILEPLANFLSLQKATLHRDLYGSRVNGYMVKRVIGIPGDTLRLASFSVTVKPRGGSDFVPESQMIPLPYKVQTTLDAKGWSPTHPLSGKSEEIRLGDDQYFVLGDNRTESSDSRSWGPVTRDRIVGKVIYRYWPPRALGTP